jgi:hypothetical protein
MFAEVCSKLYKSGFYDNYVVKEYFALVLCWRQSALKEAARNQRHVASMQRDAYCDTASVMLTANPN